MTSVLHLSSSFPRWPDDHVAPFLMDLARGQVEAGIEVDVLAPHDRGAATRERVDGVGVHRFRYAPARLERLAYRGGLPERVRTPQGLLLLPVFLLSFVLATLRLTRRLRPTVLHAHWWLPAGVCAVLVGAVTRTPVVLTVHGSDVHLLGNPLARRFGALVLRRCTVVAAVSGALRAELLQRVPLPEVGVLRLPLDVVDPGTTAATGSLRLLAAGRLSPEKGFDVLLLALREVVRERPAVSLVLVGSGPLDGELAALAAPLGEHVSMVPAESRDRLWSRFRDVDALVVPSRREGLGMVALEALAHGRPVVASRTGGLPEVVRDTRDGVLVAPDDVAALAAALVQFSATVPLGAALTEHAPAHVAAAHLAAYACAVDSA